MHFNAVSQLSRNILRSLTVDARYLSRPKPTVISTMFTND